MQIHDNSNDHPELIEQFQKAVIIGVVPQQARRVVRHGLRYARLHGVPVVFASVDAKVFVSYEDPDGYLQTAAINVRAVEQRQQSQEAVAALIPLIEAEQQGQEAISWTYCESSGDAASEIQSLAQALNATLIVLGTRKRGLGESLREFFLGSVAARLAHRQSVPVLVVPLGGDDDNLDELWPQ